ncbi:hypothetical protein [Kribbella sp. C-35]|uniref:hypothetical protein n=1 Tax=Kribbella sp. C-35 TaxID=2789276 RepID=UPI00397A45AB
MARRTGFSRSSPHREESRTTPAPAASGIEPIGPDLALAAGFLLESGSGRLQLHTPAHELPAEQVAALVVAPSAYGQTMVAYRQLIPGQEPADRHWAKGSSGGLWGPEGEAVAAELDDVAASNDPLDRQLVDSHFEPLSDGAWRYSRADAAMTAVLRDGALTFYTPASGSGMDDMVRESEVDRVVQLPDSSVEGLRLNGEWMSYTLVAPSLYPLDAEMTRPVIPAELGLPEVPRAVEPSGFVVGGENDTESIRGLTELNGHSVEQLEAWMRPADFGGSVDFGSSQDGFLGRGDKLLRTMARDNDVVRKLGLTHAELGETVQTADWTASHFGISDYLGADDQRYSIEVQQSRGFQQSPFQDGTMGSANFQVTNQRTGSTVGLSGLGGEMISRYGFYQGPGTPYRSAPEDIIRTFGDLAEKAGGEDEIKRVVAEVDAYYSAADAIGRSATGWEGRPAGSGTAAASRPDGWSPESGARRAPESWER